MFFELKRRFSDFRARGVYAYVRKYIKERARARIRLFSIKDRELFSIKKRPERRFFEGARGRKQATLAQRQKAVGAEESGGSVPGRW